MRLPALFIAASMAAVCPAVAQNLPSKDSFRPEDALQQALEQTRNLQEQRDVAARSPARNSTDTAYAKLGHALLAHPEMALHNRALISARQALQTATAAGDATITASARKHLAAVQTARYHKAASIPELKRLIDAWKGTSAHSATDKPGDKTTGEPAVNPAARPGKPARPKATLTLGDLQV